jgi:hypothetical protein
MVVVVHLSNADGRLELTHQALLSWNMRDGERATVFVG